MTAFLQSTVYGLLNGGLLALVAVGFSLVWGVMNVINLAHGAFVLIGAYIAFELNRAMGLDPFLGMFVAAVSLFAAGYLVQRYVITNVIRAPLFMTLLLTFGIELVLVNALIIIFTGNFRNIPTSYASETIALGGVQVPYGRLFAFLLSVAVTVALVVFMSRTKTGLAIRATAMDRTAARLMGVHARHIYALTFGISAGIAGVAGTMAGMVGTFSPVDAGSYTLQSFVIAVLGGLGNMWGALAGGLVLGLVQAWGGQYLPGTLINAIAFGVLVVVLIFRPTGLFGKPHFEVREEA